MAVEACPGEPDAGGSVSGRDSQGRVKAVERRVKAVAHAIRPDHVKGKGKAREQERHSDFAGTQPKNVRAAGQALPSARLSSSRAVYGVSSAEEGALRRNMRKGQAIAPRTAGFPNKAQQPIRLLVCNDSDILQMTEPVSVFLHAAAGSATEWNQCLEIIDRLQKDHVDQEDTPVLFEY